MDIRIEKKKGIRALFTKKGIPYLAGALFLVFVLWLLLRDNSSTLRVDARTISVGQVVRGEFNDYIRGLWSRRVPPSKRAMCWSC